MPLTVALRAPPAANLALPAVAAAAAAAAAAVTRAECSPPFHRTLSTTATRPKAPNPKNVIPPRPTLPDQETFKKYLKGSGPGGQKINKTSSAVQLTHLPTGIVVKSQRTRSRTQNETIARRILAEKVEQLEKGAESRVERKRDRASRRKRSAEKKRRRKYRALGAGRVGEKNQDEGVVEDEDEDVDEDQDDEDGRESYKLGNQQDRNVVEFHHDQLARLVGEGKT